MSDEQRLTIIGLGFHGASLGLAVRAARIGYRVVGHDMDPEATGRARKAGALDQAEWNLPAAVENADLVVIGTPAASVPAVLREIATYLKAGAVVTDLASAKVGVLRAADSILPAGTSFVGGHPLAEPSDAEIDEASPSATLYAGCYWCIVPSTNASERAVDRVSVLVRSLGARPLFIDADEHDAFASASTELPALLASALSNTLFGGQPDPVFPRFALASAKSATRATSAAPNLLAAAAMSNPLGLLRWLNAYRAELDRLADHLERAAATTDDVARASIAAELRALAEKSRSSRASVLSRQRSDSNPGSPHDFALPDAKSAGPLGRFPNLFGRSRTPRKR